MFCSDAVNAMLQTFVNVPDKFKVARFKHFANEDLWSEGLLNSGNMPVELVTRVRGFS